MYQAVLQKSIGNAVFLPLLGLFMTKLRIFLSQSVKYLTPSAQCATHYGNQLNDSDNLGDMAGIDPT